MNWYRALLGFVGANLLAGLFLYWLIDKWLWKRFFDNYPKYRYKQHHRDKWLTFWVGFVERILYTLALCIGASQWIGLWIGVKVATRWRSKSDPAFGPTDNIWLLGTSLSILFSCLGALIVGHLMIDGVSRWISH
jgi:hypothetical protein